MYRNRMKIMHIRHSRGRKIQQSDIIQIQENIWHVKSQSLPEEHYVIQKNVWNECVLYCEKYCEHCNVCFHICSCSCPDYSENSNLCKHIHAVFKNSNDSSDDCDDFYEFEHGLKTFYKYNKVEIRHSRGTKIELGDITHVDQNIWHVTSQTVNNTVYIVKKSGSNCNQRQCKFQCYSCHVCIHTFSCSCPDYSEHFNLCKHIHAVCIVFPNLNEDSEDSSDDDDDDSNDDNCDQNVGNVFDVHHIRGQGKCGVAVIRVSGETAGEALKLVLNSETLPKPRTAFLKHIKHPISKEILDKGLILWFPGPRSFTGEDSFELQVHGGAAVVNAILNALGSIPQLRLAEPGEFTRRAFFNAKLDLTEVEGLADLLQAETEIQRRQAFLQTEGSLSKLYNKWKTVLRNSVAHVEAHIDFDETETLEFNIIQTVAKNIEDVAKEIDKHLTDGRKGEILRSGVKTVILGEPNVGKSSLLNLLCQRPAAIVTPIEGTTRDVLEVTLNIAGYPLVLADTAGLNSRTKDIVEKEGIQRALQMYGNSDLIVLVIDTEKYAKMIENNRNADFDENVKQYVEQLKIPDLVNDMSTDKSISFNKHCIVVLNKTDVSDVEFEVDKEICVKMSCKTEDGVTDLIEKLTEKLKILCGEPSEEHPSMNQIRHRQHLTDCLKCLQLFLQKISYESESYSQDLVLMAEYLRKSLRHLGKLTGHVTTDQLLDVIFKDFCIGK